MVGFRGNRGISSSFKEWSWCVSSPASFLALAESAPQYLVLCCSRCEQRFSSVNFVAAGPRMPVVRGFEGFRIDARLGQASRAARFFPVAALVAYLSYPLAPPRAPLSLCPTALSASEPLPTRFSCPDQPCFLSRSATSAFAAHSPVVLHIRIRTFSFRF